MGMLLPRDNTEDMKCTICRKKQPVFEYMWANVEEFLLCEDCARMVGSNVTKDILKIDPDFIKTFRI